MNFQSLNLNLLNPPGGNLFFDFNYYFSRSYDVVSQQKTAIGLSDTPLTVEQCSRKIHFQFNNNHSQYPSNYPNIPVSFTEMRNNLLDVDCFINYSEPPEYSCPEIIYAKFLHEATHAIRRVHAAHLGEPVDTPPTTPSKSSTPNETRYLLNKPDVHSGYLAEHIVFGGVIVFLTGHFLVEEGHLQTLLPLNIFAKIISVEPSSSLVTQISTSYRLDKMVCQLWDGCACTWNARKTYFFQGKRWTRGEGSCGTRD